MFLILKLFSINTFAFGCCILRNNDPIGCFTLFKHGLFRIFWIFSAFTEIYQYVNPLFQPINVDSTNETENWAKLYEINKTDPNILKLRFFDTQKMINNIVYAKDQSEELSQLKPILRLIMQAMVFIILIDEVFVFFYNFIFGGTILQKFLTIDELVMVDRSRSLGRWLIVSNYILTIIIKTIGTWIYERDALFMTFFSEQKNSFLLGFVKFTFETNLQITHCISLLMNTTWFVYYMFITSRCINLVCIQMISNCKFLIMFLYFIN